MQMSEHASAVLCMDLTCEEIWPRFKDSIVVTANSEWCGHRWVLLQVYLLGTFDMLCAAMTHSH